MSRNNAKSFANADEFATMHRRTIFFDRDGRQTHAIEESRSLPGSRLCAPKNGGMSAPSIRSFFDTPSVGRAPASRAESSRLLCAPASERAPKAPTKRGRGAGSVKRGRDDVDEEVYEERYDDSASQITDEEYERDDMRRGAAHRREPVRRRTASEYRHGGPVEEEMDDEGCNVAARPRQRMMMMMPPPMSRMVPHRGGPKIELLDD